MLNNLKKIGVFAVTLPMLLVGQFLMAAPASAAGDCGAGTLCGGIGGSTGGNNGAGNGSGNGSGGSGSSGGGGTVTAPDPFLFTSRETSRNIVDSNCSVRNDGKAALGIDFSYSKKFKVTTGEKPGLNWYFYQNSSGGNITWARDIFVKKQCLYPSRVLTKTIQCPMEFFVEIRKTVPNKKTVGSASKKTGYVANSKNYNACVNAKATVNAQSKVTEYGFYTVDVWQRAQMVTVEIPYTANGLTGKIDKPKITSSSAPFNSVKKQVMSGSLDCKNGWKSPGIKSASWTDEFCGGSESSSKNPTFTCKASDPLVTSGLSGTNKWLAVEPKVQFMRDGQWRDLKFNQTIAGKGIKVETFKTKFERSGSPYDSSLSARQNLFELKNGSSNLLTSHNGSGWKTGKIDLVKFRGFTASNGGNGTTITQKIQWTGTRDVKSVIITNVDGKTGAVSTKTITTKVPTLGYCSDSANLEFVRAIGTISQ